MTGAVKRCSAMCCHCGSGIPYEIEYFHCLVCDLSFCNSCHKRHPRSHSTAFKTISDTALSRNSPQNRKECTICQKLVDGLVECTDCEANMCYVCWPDHFEKFTDHEHNSLRFTQIPDDYCMDSFKLSCSSCKTGSSISHCTYCYEGIKEEERIYECKDCLERYDLSPSVCKSCYPILSANHTSGHQWITYVYIQKEGADDDLFQFQCVDCYRVLESGSQNIIRHPHNAFRVTMGAIERQGQAHRAYRRCPRRSPKNIDRPDTELYGDDTGCQCCYERFSRDPKTYFCTTCCFSSCSKCYENGVLNHPYEMFCMWKKTTTAPDDFWQKLVNGDCRSCDFCQEAFRPDLTSYAQCKQCENFDVCETCLFAKKPLSMDHSTCPGRWMMQFFDPQPMGEGWVAEQVRLADAAKAKIEAEAQGAEEAAQRQREREATAARQAAQRKQQTAQLLAPASRPLARAPSPAPVRATASLAPPPQRQAQRRKSSSGLGAALLRGAIGIATGVVNAEVRQMNNGGGGAIYVAQPTYDFSSGGGGGGGMDMSSFWAPINAAASAPIQ